MAGNPSISCFDVREGGGAVGSPPLYQNTRRRVGEWQEAPLSHISMRGRVVGLEKALHHIETQEGGWVDGRKPPSHVSTQGRVVRLEKALHHIKTQEGGCKGVVV